MHVIPFAGRLRAAQGGFTLIELLVTLVVVSVGMLGLAKLQAAAVAESQVSRVRALMTMQAEALAGMMRANRGYWAAPATPPSFTVAAGGAVTMTAGTMTAKTGGCIVPVGQLFVAGLCTPSNIAYEDIQRAGTTPGSRGWAPAFAAAFPTSTAVVACATPAGMPTSCDITLTWNEHYVSINRSTAGTGAKTSDAVSMVLHVQP